MSMQLLCFTFGVTLGTEPPYIFATTEPSTPDCRTRQILIGTPSQMVCDMPYISTVYQQSSSHFPRESIPVGLRMARYNVRKTPDSLMCSSDAIPLVLVRNYSTSSASLRSEFGPCLYGLLRDKDSALSLFKGDAKLGILLFTFDLLRATRICWSRFLRDIRDWSQWVGRRRQLTKLHKPLTGDWENLASVSRAIRDLVQALELTISAIDQQLETDSDEKRRFDDLVFKERAYCLTVENTLKDVETMQSGRLHASIVPQMRHRQLL